MKDKFRNQSSGLTSPATRAAAIVPDDIADLERATRALYVGTGGDACVELISGEMVTLVNLQPGMYYPLRIKRILATGTTAENLVGMS